MRIFLFLVFVLVSLKNASIAQESIDPLPSCSQLRAIYSASISGFSSVVKGPTKIRSGYTETPSTLSLNGANECVIQKISRSPDVIPLLLCEWHAPTNLTTAQGFDLLKKRFASCIKVGVVRGSESRTFTTYSLELNSNTSVQMSLRKIDEQSPSISIQTMWTTRQH